jgi:uncharacterized protein (TIGR03083 family)
MSTFYRSSKLSLTDSSCRASAVFPRTIGCDGSHWTSRTPVSDRALNLCRMNPAAPAWVAALRGSHERLRALVGRLTPDQLIRRAYPARWSIAEVLSHLGSGAEIFIGLVNATVAGQPAPGREAYPPVWEVWDAKAAVDQAADSIAVNQRLVELFEELVGGPGALLRFDFVGRELDLAGMAGVRLSEHALHSWDVAVALDPSATVAAPSVALLIDVAPQIVARGRWRLPGVDPVPPAIGPPRVRVVTTGPAREFALTLGEKVRLGPWPGDGGPHAAAEVHLPAEALLRLFAGRLDPEHTPAAVTTTGVTLDILRAAFPGY